MKIKNELTPAFQLVGLLCLLFWSFTWNIPKDFDLSKPKNSPRVSSEDCLEVVSHKKGFGKRYIFTESFKSDRYFGNNAGSSLLPPFNVWKEVELRKQEIKDVQDRIPVAKVPRRKLNYASAKCGAKILASNKESKHRMSILNEKVDEYMLNPCGIKVWFILELCDTIEASQIELANYELYSSMPKDFSVFWSNVYPTQTWHQLGTFQAKNQRSMQTFNIDLQNLGKFIKVIIFSHHGQEHFCPLSVFRVVGYSMVYEYDVIEEQKERKQNKNDSNKNGEETTLSEESFSSSNTYPSIKQMTLETNPHSNSKTVAFPIELCRKIQNYCSTSHFVNASWNQSICLFFKAVILKYESLCDNICVKELPTRNFVLTKSFSKKSENFKTEIRSELYTPDNTFKNSSYGEEKAKLKNSKTLNLFNSSSTSRKTDKQSINISGKDKLNRTVEKQTYPNVNSSEINVASITKGASSQNSGASKTDDKQSKNKNKQKDDSVYQCDCPKVPLTVERPSPKENSSSETSLFEHDVADSAALIQKESVLVKLNMRIKTLETNLSLINRYLQHLSESYRKQVEGMLSMFDGTVKAIRTTSAKAAVVDKQQQLIIDQLDRKVNFLSMKVQHLDNGQSDILKQVLELHGFFLILEVIIMSAIFNVFLNKFKRDGLI